MKRYECCKFPSLYGTPWYTNSWIVARLWVFFTTPSCFERRVIDRKTGKHYVY